MRKNRFLQIIQKKSCRKKRQLAIVFLGVYAIAGSAGAADAEDLAGYLSNSFLHFGYIAECGAAEEDELLRGTTSSCEEGIDTATKSGPSVAPDGALGAPFYAADGLWKNLTYRQYPMEFAVTVGTGGGLWLDAGQSEFSYYYDGNEPVDDYFPYDTLPEISVSSEPGFKIVTASGGIATVGGVQLEISHQYRLPNNAPYIRAITTVKVLSGNAEALRVFVGTYDDYIAGSDDTTKQRGNLEDGEFVPLSIQEGANGDESNAVLISGATAGIVFYALGGDRIDAIISEDYDLDDVVDLSDSTIEVNGFGDPSEVPVLITDDDGAYMISVLLGDMAEGTSRSFDWFYAAGDVNDLSTVTNSVAEGSQAPGAPTGVTLTAGPAELAVSWTTPEGDIDFCTATADPGGATCMAAAGVDQCTISSLSPQTSYNVTVACSSEGVAGAAGAASGGVTPLSLPTSVPINPLWSLLASAGMLGLVGSWRQRRQARRSFR